MFEYTCTLTHSRVENEEEEKKHDKAAATAEALPPATQTDR